jgi:hypothetical protein
VTKLRALFARFRRWLWGGTDAGAPRAAEEARRKVENDVSQHPGGFPP